jgi:hypothetical protein
MKDELMRSPSIQPAKLPDDFARRVIAQARREQYQRRVRFRIATAVCAMVIVALIPLSRTPHSPRPNPGASDSSPIAWQDDAIEASSAQLAAATAPDDVSDYLMPNATRVVNFADYDSEASWQYDPDWANRS